MTLLAELAIFEVPFVPERLFAFRVEVYKSAIAKNLTVAELAFINFVFSHN